MTNVEPSQPKGWWEPSGTINMDGVVFLNLTLREATTSQLVYVMSKVTGLLKSQRTFKELRAMDRFLFI